MSGYHDFAATLRARQHQELFAYWRAKAPEGRLPGRQHIDPVEIPRLLPWIVLHDVIWEADTPRFRVRLTGTGIVQRYGRDSTGRWFEEIYEGAILKRQIADHSEVARTGRPYLSTPTLPVPNKEFITYNRLILPLAKDGRLVDNLIVMAVFD